MCLPMLVCRVHSLWTCHCPLSRKQTRKPFASSNHRWRNPPSAPRRQFTWSYDTQSGEVIRSTESRRYIRRPEGQQSGLV